MKKLSMLLMVLVLAMSVLVGCGGSDEDKNENNNDLTYFVTTAKGKDSFYLVTMQSKKADFKTYEENFKTWAKSLKFDIKNEK